MTTATDTTRDSREARLVATRTADQRVDRDNRDTVGTQFVDNPRMTCREVNVYYGDKHAIKNVTIDVGKNEVLAMIGPSGCGKSTFLRCLNRMNDCGRLPGDRRDPPWTTWTSTTARWTWCPCAPGRAWSSRNPTPSPSRSSKTWPTGRRSTVW